MKTDVQGCSTVEPGKEQYEKFRHGRKNMVQYDYRHTNGELFSTVAINVIMARRKRDQWLVNNGWKDPNDDE